MPAQQHEEMPFPKHRQIAVTSFLFLTVNEAS